MDDLIGGQSTFMVEMKEANFALENATPRSLILFDEIGRGTATYDGMALAEAIIEFIHDRIHAKTLFSTHYHELTILEERLDKLVNVHVGAVEDEGDLVFLHKMETGPTDKSYGVQVAKLAGLPNEVIQQANEIMEEFEKEEHNPFVQEKNSVSQMTLFQSEMNEDEQEILDELKELDINNLTPLDTFEQLNNWLKRLKS
jgi:DNA mismatch repair protein MutS